MCAIQELNPIGFLKLGRARKVPTHITITDVCGNPVLFGVDATSSEQVKYGGLTSLPIPGDLITYTPVPGSSEVDGVVVGHMNEKSVKGTNIVAFGTDGIMPVTAKVLAVV